MADISRIQNKEKNHFFLQFIYIKVLSMVHSVALMLVWKTRILLQRCNTDKNAVRIKPKKSEEGRLEAKSNGDKQTAE